MSGRRQLMRVVVVEDSSVQRAHLKRVLEADGDIAVIGEAADAASAVSTVAALQPEAVTVDLHIPGGGGQHAIEQIMGHTPTPILVVSSHVSNRESAPAIEALVAGALDAVPKPAHWTSAAEADIRERVRGLRGATVLRHPRGRLAGRSRAPASSAGPADGRIVAIAASTGGPPALAEVLAGLGGIAAPVLVVQHIHPEFVAGLVAWMLRIAPIPVALASDGQPAEAGHVYIAPGGTHLRVAPDRRLVLDPYPESLHRPSADQLFLSVAKCAKSSGIGVVLTGMGDDGAAGLMAIRRHGGLTIAQDRETSAVFGMPQAAQHAGAVVQVLPVTRIAAAVMQATNGDAKKSGARRG